jgi:tetratricopeptide (TPR) repeat protein
MARAYMARQEFEPALKHLEKAVEINPGASKFRYVLSGVYRKLGKIEESQREVEAFRKLSAQELETFRRMSGREMGGAAREPMEEPRRTPDAPSYRKQ